MIRRISASPQRADTPISPLAAALWWALLAALAIRPVRVRLGALARRIGVVHAIIAGAAVTITSSATGIIPECAHRILGSDGLAGFFSIIQLGSFAT